MTTTVVEPPEPAIDSGDNIVVVAPEGGGETHCEHCVDHEGRIAVLETRLPAVEVAVVDAAVDASDAQGTAGVALDAALDAIETAAEPVVETEPETVDEPEVSPGKHPFFKTREELFTK